MKLTQAELDALHLDVDLRTTEVWGRVGLALEMEGDALLLYIGTLIRAAYGKGYVDALSEPEAGTLCREHGFSLPERLAPYTMKDGA